MTVTHKKSLISIADDETLYFVEMTSRGDSNAVGSIPLESLLAGDPQADTVLAAIKGRKNALLIVPDYWLGNSSYKFQSRKKSLAEAYVTRKLQEQFPDQPEVGDFFELTFYLREKAEKWIYAFFPAGPAFFSVISEAVTVEPAAVPHHLPRLYLAGEDQTVDTRFRPGRKRVRAAAGRHRPLVFLL